MTPGTRFPDYTASDGRRTYTVTDLVLIERPMDMTDAERKALTKAGKPWPTVSYVVGRCV